MFRFILHAATVFLTLSASVQAAQFTFDTDPFAGSTALDDPGRQIVGGETFITFEIASDVFAIAPAVFGVGNQVLFASGLAANLPASGLNVVVLQSFDNDGDPTTPFAAGGAANLIADRITSSGPGFFIYFNSALNLPRLVFSTDLSDNTADLKILARLMNLTGQEGKDAMATFTSSNFVMLPGEIPEPSTFLLMTAATGLLGYIRVVRRRRIVGQQIEG